MGRIIDSIVTRGFPVWQDFDGSNDLIRGGRFNLPVSFSRIKVFEYAVNIVNCFRVENIRVGWELILVLVGKGFDFFGISAGMTVSGL